MDVSVIIVNYNTKQLTLNCINSIFEYTKEVVFEVILVDNASTDGSKDLFCKYTDIKYIYSETNLGFGKANNLGLKCAVGKYILFLNSDTLLCNNAVKYFFDFMEKHAQLHLGAVGCLLQDGNGNTVCSYGKLPTVINFLVGLICNPVLKRFGVRFPMIDYSKINGDKEYYAVEFVIGADLFIRREILDKCGAFDPDFFMYYEESELQFRFKKHGLLNVIITQPKIIHFEGESSNNMESSLFYRKTILQQKSNFIYMKKCSHKNMYYLYRTLLFLFRIPWLLSRKITMCEKKQFYKILMSKTINL
jgi:GT2 family glycosyltransferase